MKPLRLLAVFLIIVVGVAGFRVAGANQSPDLKAYLDAETVQLGQVLYEEYCAACHGRQLEGDPNWQVRSSDGYLPAPPHDATGHTWHHPTEQLFQITKLGTEAVVGGGYVSNMAGFSDVLSDKEIYAVLAYIKSTWPDRIIERHAQLDAAYSEAQKP